MDPQIHGAIVGGVIGGGTLAVGVVASEWLQRARNRRAAFEADPLALARLLPHVTMPASALWNGPRPKAEDPTWFQNYSSAHDKLLLLYQQCRGFFGAKAALAELRQLIAHFNVLLDAFIATGRVVAEDEIPDLRADKVLRAAIKQPKGGYVDELESAYRTTRGIPSANAAR
jgi:hypothetical protein